MSRIFILSAYQITAAQFFEKILSMRADLVLDIRLKNESQLCGFTKKRSRIICSSNLPCRVYLLL